MDLARARASLRLRALDARDHARGRPFGPASFDVVVVSSALASALPEACAVRDA